MSAVLLAMLGRVQSSFEVFFNRYSSLSETSRVDLSFSIHIGITGHVRPRLNLTFSHSIP